MNSQSNHGRGVHGAPTRFRCKVGGEWKDLSEFSNAQQRNLQRGDRNVDPAHSGMTCKQHSAGSRSELKCDLCLLVKPLDEFSKNSRRKGEYQCRRCVAWIEIQEPSLTPGPLETGHISPEEEQQQMLKQRFVTSDDFFADDDDLVPRAPITALSSLGLDESYAQALGSASISELLSNSHISAAGSTSSSVPPHLSNRVPTAAASDTSSVRGSEITLPPHLRKKHKSVSEATSSASSTAGDISLPTTLRESDSDAASILNQAFNAWDPSGNMQRRHVGSFAASESSDAASFVSTENNDPNVVGDWTCVTSGPKTALPKRKGGWAKGPNVRLSAAEIRESLGDVHQTYMRREIDTQKLVRPIGYDDSDSD